LSREICAFTNANGGKILLGVTDNGEIKGIEITNNLRSQIQNIARNLDPPISVDVNDVDGVLVFDEKPNVDFELDNDLDDNKLNFFLDKAKISQVLEKKDILDNLYLLKDGYLKNAGVLLFCRRITKFFPQATITCVLYRGKTKYKILDRKEYDEDIYLNYHNAFNYIQSKLNTEFIIKGGPREERLELPEDALREGLLNAIAHRDYFISGANILVDIFFDRVEITNPGGLVKGLKREDLGKRSLSRNNLLFGLMQRMELVEKVGSGIVRMERGMEKYGLKKPRFDINDNWFSIIFDRPVQRLSETTWKTPQKTPQKTPRKTPRKILTELEAKILGEIKKDPHISRIRIANVLKLSEYTVKEYLEKLKHKEVIERIGPAKGGYWRVRKDDE
jgi:ATP-dependent DNA helicase RecG